MNQRPVANANAWKNNKDTELDSSIHSMAHSEDVIGPGGSNQKAGAPKPAGSQEVAKRGRLNANRHVGAARPKKAFRAKQNNASYDDEPYYQSEMNQGSTLPMLPQTKTNPPLPNYESQQNTSSKKRKGRPGNAQRQSLDVNASIPEHQHFQFQQAPMDRPQLGAANNGGGSSSQQNINVQQIIFIQMHASEGNNNVNLNGGGSSTSINIVQS